MVAKSYQNMEIVSDVYTVSGRNYVKVRDFKGAERQVRWYSDKEYARMYGTPVDHSNDPFYKTQKQLFGFDKTGFITIFKGNTFAAKDEIKALEGARYTRLWGWGVPGDVEIPEIPGVETLHLEWDAVGNEDGSLKTDEFVETYMSNLLLEPSASQFQGTIGERVRGLSLKATRVIGVDGHYGRSYIHNFEDCDSNVYVWITASKCLEEDSTYIVDGTIKDHKMYKNIPQTILTRCKVTLVEEDEEE